MKITSGLNKQIFLAMAVVGLLPLLVMAFQNHYFAQKVIEDAEKEHLTQALRSRLLWLRTWVSHTRQDFYQLAFDDGGGQYQTDEEAFHQAARKLFKGHLTYRSISVYRPDWSLLTRYPDNFQGEVFPPSAAYKEKLEVPGGLFVVGADFRIHGNKIILPVGQGMLNQKGELGAFLVAEINLSDSLDRILGDTSDLNDGGRYILTDNEGAILYKSNNKEHDSAEKKSCGVDSEPEEVLISSPWQVQEKTDCSTGGIYYVSVPIPEMKWRLVAHFGSRSGLRQFQDYVRYGLVTALATLLVLIVLALNLSKRLAAPLDKLTRVARRISAGQHNERLPSFKEPYAREVGEAFNAMMDALEKQQQSMIQSTTLSTVGEMSSSLVHEMRNPLSSIKINLQALARKVKDDQGYSEMSSIALMQVERLEGMFADLLRFSKPLEIHKESITFAELAEEVVTTLKSEAEEKSIELRVEDRLQGIRFPADRENSCRALSNLVGNAIQWSESGEVVTITGRRSGPEQDAVVISVTDNGPGLRPEQMEKLFQPFYTTREHGTGLGLANVKKIMDYQGGSVLAINGDEGGAVFSLIFEG